jgi:hypothetical protein
VAFSVESSHSPTGTLVPSAVMASATSQRQPDRHAHGQQALAGRGGDVGHGHAQLVGQLGQRGGVLVGDEANG